MNNTPQLSDFEYKLQRQNIYSAVRSGLLPKPAASRMLYALTNRKYGVSEVRRGG